MDYPQNLSKSDQRWYDLIQECRTSGKSDRQWLLANCAFRDYKLKKIAGPITQAENIRSELRKQL